MDITSEAYRRFKPKYDKQNNNDHKSKETENNQCRVSWALLILGGLLFGGAVAIGAAIYISVVKEIDDGVVINLSYGTLKGNLIQAPYDKTVRRFLGIPYAKPPIGNLRFSNPVELDDFPQDPYIADSYQYSCHQFLDTTYGEFSGSNMWNAPNPLREDCLFINIWAPIAPGHQDDRKWPVLVWIYGGGFYSGSSALDVYEGTALASYGDVIFVSFNYRLAALGFFATGDERIQGNFGLMDQVLALQWIQKNIKYFGGDPEKVTIFGESAGAVSVGLHLLSPLSNGLFKRAVMQSGSPTAKWGFMSPTEAKARSDIFLAAVNCQIENAIELLHCLQELDVQAILNNEWVESHYMVFPWAPTIDNSFLHDTPQNLLSSNQIKAVDLLVGTNANEGTFFNLYSLPGLNQDDPDAHHNISMFREALDTLNWDLTPSERNRVEEFYITNEIKNVSDLIAVRDALDKVSGDRYFTCPTQQFAQILLNIEGHRQYYYYLSHRASNEVWPQWMGVIHGAEIQWIFGMPLLNQNQYLPKEVELSQTVIKYISNFAETGDPNDQFSFQWPQNSAEHTQILEFQLPSSFHIMNDLRMKYCDFWESI